ncbi:hypothetical protein CGSMWGv00703C2mash_06056 [Gardnerella pickettii 00703C2mash]|nr:hypothetical protein CGSMWGv00703C2mash_06056 [Gardnerella pickettii 00703C2mash]
MEPLSGQKVIKARRIRMQTVKTAFVVANGSIAVDAKRTIATN